MIPIKKIARKIKKEAVEDQSNQLQLTMLLTYKKRNKI